MNLARQQWAEATGHASASLRMLQPSDESFYREIYCDAETMRYIGEPLSSDQATRSFRTALKRAACESSTSIVRIVVDARTCTKLGICGATLGVPRLGYVEAGVVLSRNARDKRLSRGIFMGFVEYLFTSSSTMRVQVRYAMANIAMRRLALSLAFEPCESPIDRGNFDPWSWAFISRERWSAFCATYQQG
jgi:RimJ/RimL family protein N-acetyltransferase